MKVLTQWLRSYLPELTVDDAQLAEDLTLRGIAVEGIYSLGEGNGSLYEMDITTNRVDAMNHYGVAREAAAIYGLTLASLDAMLPAATPGAVNRGTRPARTSEDFPAPLAPTTSRNGLCRSAAYLNRSMARSTSLERPKKTAA